MSMACLYNRQRRWSMRAQSAIRGLRGRATCAVKMSLGPSKALQCLRSLARIFRYGQSLRRRGRTTFGVKTLLRQLVGSTQWVKTPTMPRAGSCMDGLDRKR